MSKEKSEKWKALSSALSAIEKQFGKGAVMRMGEDTEPQVVSVIASKTESTRSSKVSPRGAVWRRIRACCSSR